MRTWRARQRGALPSAALPVALVSAACHAARHATPAVRAPRNAGAPRSSCIRCRGLNHETEASRGHAPRLAHR